MNDPIGSGPDDAAGGSPMPVPSSGIDRIAPSEVAPSAVEPSVIVPSHAAGEAPPGTRAGAFLIDFAVMLGVVILVGRISGNLATAVAIAYLLTRDTLPFLDGQSIGKKALKIRAVTEDGRSLSGNWAPGLVRNAVLCIPFFVFVELIVLIVGKDKPGGLRRLGDQWAKTKVVAVQ